MICRINGIAENYGTVYTTAKNSLVIRKKLCAEIAQNLQHWDTELQKALRRISKISAQNSRSPTFYWQAGHSHGAIIQPQPHMELMTSWNKLINTYCA